jgi:hypothetical protein
VQNVFNIETNGHKNILARKAGGGQTPPAGNVCL